jgi:hypothetical protein
MRRWLVVLLLVLMPLQMSWAAAASYCEHEIGAGADHFGHHDLAAHGHGHGDGGAVPDDAVSSDAATSPAPTTDCGHCHGYGAGLVAVMPSLQAQALSGTAPSAVEPAYAEHLSAQPERPQWAFLA